MFPTRIKDSACTESKFAHIFLQFYFIEDLKPKQTIHTFIELNILLVLKHVFFFGQLILPVRSLNALTVRFCVVKYFL